MRYDLLAVVSTCAMSCQSQGGSTASRFAPFNW
nr:MAG TPA_asm: MltD lipid attachment motif [Caudoviricetes sp.]